MPSTSPGLKVATIRGVPVYIGSAWPLIAVIIVALFGPQVANLHPEWGMAAYLLAAAYAVLLLLSVLVHEAAHALTGQACGYRVNRIVADLWGGHTAYDSPDATPGRSALVAVVGPASNLAMAALGWFALQHVQGVGAGHLLLLAFTYSNAFVGLFNLLPGLPLDGGFIVDALVWKLTGNRAKGLLAAGWCGRIVAIGVVLWALVPFLRGEGVSTWNLVWFVFIAMFLWRGASTAVTVGSNRQFLSGIHVAQVMRDAAAVPAETPVSDLPEGPSPIVLLDAGNQPVAVVAPGAHVRVPMAERGRVPASALGEVIAPGAKALVADPGADITAILPAFEGEPTPNLVVVTQPAPASAPPTGERAVGVVLLTDLERALQAHAGAKGRGLRST